MSVWKRIRRYFSMVEILLWSSSVVLIVGSYFLFDRESGMTLIASLIGVTSLIFCAKGNPIGQVLMVLFSLFYGIISFAFAYYGEMITYLGMALPMAIFSLISWMRHPYKGDRSQVEVDHIGKKEFFGGCLLTFAVSVVFYFLLKFFNTANLIPSTISVATSFLAVYLTFRRSPYFALAYAANDIVLIVLWTLASFSELHYLSVVVCFVAFLMNDLYSFINWRRMERMQREQMQSIEMKEI